MISKDFVTGLAEAMQVEPTELATVDRALAKAGLRQVAKGRHRPDISLLEGLQIVFGWAAASKLTAAADEIERLKYFRASRGDVLDPDDPNEGMDDLDFLQIYGCPQVKLAGKDVFSVAAIVAGNLSAGRHDPKDFWARVDKGGSVYFAHGGLFHRRGLSFDDLGIKIDFDQKCKRTFVPVTTTVAVSGVVLKWVFDVTEGA